MTPGKKRKRRFKMSQQAQVLNQLVPGEKGQSTVRWKISILAIGLTALVLVALAVLTVTPAGKPAMLPQEGDSRFVTNPELMIVRRYAASLARQAESNFLAANPELMVARRYTGLVQAESSFLAANPELSIVRHYTGPVSSESSLLAANPELMIARRYTCPAQSESSFLAANPELMAARRYTGAVTEETEASFLAANPELMAARRYRSGLTMEHVAVLSVESGQ
jgi:hypothetical protein